MHESRHMFSTHDPAASIERRWSNRPRSGRRRVLRLLAAMYAAAVCAAFVAPTGVRAEALNSPRSASVDPPARSIAEFKPSLHGFRFVNSFTGSPLPQGLDALGTLAGAPSRFGLCGGMSFAAADFFLARREIPQASKAPARGEPLYDMIYRRQVHSFNGLAAPARFADWMRRPDAGPLGTRHLTLSDLPDIVSALDAGNPVVLGLVYASAGEPLWHNHQVLAIGSSSVETAGRTIRIYDPNYPANDSVTITCRRVITGSFTLPGLLGVRIPVLGAESTLVAPAIGTQKARTKTVRGLFAMPYQPVDPETEK